MSLLFLFILTGSGGVSSVSGGGGSFINCRRGYSVLSQCLLVSRFLQMLLYRKYDRRSWSWEAKRLDIAGPGWSCCTCGSSELQDETGVHSAWLIQAAGNSLMVRHLPEVCCFPV